MEHQNRNEEIRRIIAGLTAAYPEKESTETHWREPLVAFADAKDPLFAELKDIVSPTHALPGEIVPGAKTVVTFFLPFDEKTIKSNIGGTDSSREWNIATIETNKLITAVNEALHDYFTAEGYQSSLLPPTYHYDEVNLRSDWSHKSAAYISGLGTFGLHRLLITEKGCCGRFGSVITDMDMEHTSRAEEEYCLFKAKGSCKKCVEHCPARALAVREGTDIYERFQCNDQIYGKPIPVYPQGTGDACGKCMCGVPCAMKKPVK